LHVLLWFPDVPVFAGLAVAKQAQQIKLAKAAKQWHQALESRAWRSWQTAAAEAKSRRQIAARWMQPAKVISVTYAAAAAYKVSHLSLVPTDGVRERVHGSS
jgi:hypothetical protein